MTLKKEHQKILISFLMNVLKDSKEISIKCDCSHHDWYFQITDLMKELQLINIKEDWNINTAYWRVKIEFLSPLRNLFDMNEKPSFLEIINDFSIKYNDEIFNLHKPSDIRNLIYLINREHGYSELQCEYNKRGL